jgi:HK97 family phage major capsid protein
VVRQNITKQLAALVQKCWINGTGANSQPSGILYGTTYSNIVTVFSGGATVVGTNTAGSATAYPDWVRLRTAVAKADVPLDSCGFLTNSLVVGSAAMIKRGLATTGDTNPTDSRMIIDDLGNFRVAGFPVWETNSVPHTLVKGASGATLSANIFGAWPYFYGAFWSGINLELLRDATIGIQGLYRLAAAVYYDGGVINEKAFAKCIDIVAA